MKAPTKWTLAGCGALVVCACAAAPASATSVSLAGPDSRFGSPGAVLVNAGSPRDHDVKVSYERDSDVFVITDSKRFGFLEAGCEQTGERRVRCQNPAPEGPADVFVSSGKGDDRLRTDKSVKGFVTLSGGNGRNVIRVARKAKGGSELEGGDGRDKIFGSAGRDSIDDFAGADLVRARGADDIVFVDLRSDEKRGHNRIFGGAGNDLVLAKNGHGGDRIDCGRGGGDEVGLDRIDPKPRSCERIRRYRRGAGGSRG